MALRTPALFMGNPAVNHTAQSMRLAKAGLLRPETGQAAATRPLTAASGVLAGPTGTMGEVTLLSNTQFTVNPARWFIESSDTPLGGVYEVTNDAVETIAVTAQDATQFRKAYFGVWVIDSFVAGSGDDQPHWGLVNGPLAASNPQLPAAGTLPENFLALGEFLIPPTGQSVTYTGYYLRTGPRGGILNTLDGDTRAPAYDGQGRYTPTLGLQVGIGGAWGLTRPAQRITVVTAASPGGNWNLPSAAAAPTAIPWASAWGPAAGWSAATPTRLFPAEGAGNYDLLVYAQFGANATGTRGLAHRVNGGTWVLWDVVPPASASYGTTITGTYPGMVLAATDYIEVGAWQDSGAAMNMVGGNQRAGLQRVS